MRKYVRVKEPTQPIFIDGRYRVRLERINRHWQYVVEPVEWENGRPVLAKTCQTVEILVDGTAAGKLN